MSEGNAHEVQTLEEICLVLGIKVQPGGVHKFIH